jgi:hypothetical protein
MGALEFARDPCRLRHARTLTVESDGSEDDWKVVGPAILAAAVRHLRAIAQLQEAFPSVVVSARA